MNGQEINGQGENQSNKEKRNVDKFSSEKLKRAQAMRQELKEKMDAYRAAKVRKEELRQAQDELKKTLAKARRDIDRERKKLLKQEDKLREIAGWIKEKNEDRAHHAIKGFFEVLNLFDDENHTFSNEYNSLHSTEKVCQALLASAKYHGAEKDYVSISGTKLRQLIQAEKDKFEADMKEAREILGLDVDALLAEQEKEKSDKNLTDGNSSDEKGTDGENPADYDSDDSNSEQIPAEKITDEENVTETQADV